RWRLQEWKKHSWLRIFAQFHIFTVFHDAHNLDPRSILHLVISADGVGGRGKHLDRKLPIHHGYGRRVLIVMPGEGPAGQQGSTGGMKVLGRYLVLVGHASGIRWPEISGFFIEDIYPAAGAIDQRRVIVH